MAKRVRTPPAPSAKPRYRITTWRDYNRALVARGSIALWIHEEVLAGWRATGGKGRRYGEAAILAALTRHENRYKNEAQTKRWRQERERAVASLRAALKAKNLPDDTQVVDLTTDDS